MKNILLFLMLPFLSVAQVKTGGVYVHASLKGAGTKHIFITWEGRTDTILCNREGDFSWKGRSVDHPGTITIRMQDGLQFQLFVAPGFNLGINAETGTHAVFYKSLILSGIGAHTNRYWKQNYLLAHSYAIAPLTDQWYAIAPGQFGHEGLEMLKLDSLANATERSIFGKDNKDPYVDVFRRQVIASLQFRKMYYAFAYAYMNELPVMVIDTLLTRYIDPACFSDLSRDSMLSDFFYTQCVAFYYPGYLVDKKAKDHPEVNENRLNNILKIVSSVYKGKTRDYVMSRIIRDAIRNIYSQDRLDTIGGYIGMINDKHLRAALLHENSERKKQIIVVSKGMPAPGFSLADNKGVVHDLHDFAGKVVYIDLWASWCGPCREELPFMKRLSEQFSGEQDLVLLSIAVKDSAGAVLRERLIEQLNPGWLFLEDRSDEIWTGYKVLAIPRFILIGRDGKIIDFDAPRPSEKERLLPIIRDALAE